MKKSTAPRDLAGMTNHELVNLYNQYIGEDVMPLSIAKLLWHIVNVLKNRGVNCDAITHGTSIHYGKQFHSIIHRTKIYLSMKINEKSSIRIHFKNDKASQTIDVKVIQTSEANITLSHLIGELPVLVMLDHLHLQTHIDATGVQGKVLIGFNDEGKFESLNILNSVEAGRFAILSQARTALVLPFGWENEKIEYWDFE
ncbi:MAG: hypothetical protein RLZ33_2385 [Bacteroidota bacterium]|jgi:hypothetical protein